LRGLLVDKVIAALDGIKGMPFGFILLDIAKRRADSALGCAGMAADRIEFGEHCRLRLLAGLECRIQSGASGADDDRVKLIDHVFLLLVNVMVYGQQLTLICKNRIQRSTVPSGPFSFLAGMVRPWRSTPGRPSFSSR